MDFKTTGGPAYPTLSGGLVDEEGTFRFEGLTVFDYFVGMCLQSGASPFEAVRDARETMKYRNCCLYPEEVKES